MINKQKSDLNKDGKLSSYEKKRGMAIAKAMSGRKKLRSGGCAQLTGFGKARRPNK
jgi:hypothetical protein